MLKSYGNITGWGPRSIPTFTDVCFCKMWKKSKPRSRKDVGIVYLMSVEMLSYLHFALVRRVYKSHFCAVQFLCVCRFCLCSICSYKFWICFRFCEYFINWRITVSRRFLQCLIYVLYYIIPKLSRTTVIAYPQKNSLILKSPQKLDFNTHADICAI